MVNLGVGHGRLNAIFLPEVMRFNYSKDKLKLDNLSVDLGFNTGTELISFIDEIKEYYSISDLSSYTDSDVQEIVIPSLINNIRQDITYRTTPFEISDEELIKLLNKNF